MTEPVRRIVWSFVAIWTAAALVLALQGVSIVKGRQLAKENRDRIHDIQQSRVESCQRTYEGVREVFTPFFQPPAKRTPQQRRDIKKFNDTIDRLKARCDDQTKPDQTEG